MKPSRRAWPIFKDITARLASSRRGAAAVEFALLAPVIAVVVVSVADYGIAVYDKMELVSAARAVAQLAIVNKTNSTTTERDAIDATVVASTNLSITTTDVDPVESYLCLDGSDNSYSVIVSATCTGGDPIQYYMTVTITDADYTLFLSGLSWPLSGSVKVRTK